MMFLARFKDTKQVVARRRTEKAAHEVIRRRRKSCPAEFEVVAEEKKP